MNNGSESKTREKIFDILPALFSGLVVLLTHLPLFNEIVEFVANITGIHITPTFSRMVLSVFLIVYWCVIEYRQEERGTGVITSGGKVVMKKVPVYSKAQRWMGRVVLCFGILLAGLQIYRCYHPRPGPNIYQYYSFEVDDAKTKCWRARTDLGIPLGGPVTPVPTFLKCPWTSCCLKSLLDKTNSEAREAQCGSRQAIRFDLNLARTPNPALDQVEKAQFDSDVKHPDCPGKFEIPAEGQMYALLYLPDDAPVGLILEAEFFLQFVEPDEWHVNQPPVRLIPGEVVELVWNNNNETWRDWEAKTLAGAINIAYGIEIKLAADSVVDHYEGPVFVDEVVITTDTKPFRSPDY
jgi:hypothetical protein